MASSRGSSDTPDWTDVCANLTGFESLNKVRIEVRMHTSEERGEPDVAVTVIAHSLEGQIGDLPPLASANVRCSALRLKTLESVIIHALYRLDFQLGVNELEGTKPK